MIRDYTDKEITSHKSHT